MIDITKKYRTRDGKPVRILATDLKGTLPIVVAINVGDYESIIALSPEGRQWSDMNTPCDLIEVSPYEDYALDDPVMAVDYTGAAQWFRGHFAGISNGAPTVYKDGKTSWTASGRRVCVASVRRPTKEELK